VQNGQDDDCIVWRPKVDGVRERVQQSAAYITGDQRELKWAFGNPRERPIDIIEEPS
jgi:hypothetical protein